MRATLASLLTAAAKADPKIIVLTGDHGHALFADFRVECASQFLNCGIAEQNMIGVAAGLAHEGFRPIVYAAAAFMPTRVVEQIKLDLCWPGLPVILIGDGAGMAYGQLGPSHHACEDVALLRSLPNLAIYSPGDRHGLARCFAAARNRAGPSYLRIGKGDRGDLALWSSIQQGHGPLVLLVATGSMVKTAQDVAMRLPHACILNVESLRPFDAERLLANVAAARLVVTLEEHFISGGLGSAVAEILAAQPGHPPLLRCGVPDAFREKVGSWDYLIRGCGLDPESITGRIEEVLRG